MTLELAAYGSLPLARDLLSCGVTSEAGRGFVRLLQGIAPALVEVPAIGGLSMQVLWRSAPRSTVAALVRPSTDTGGHRPFPFGVFVEVPWDPDDAHPETAYSCLSPTIDSLSQAWDDAAAQRDEDSFLRVLRGRKVAAPLQPALASTHVPVAAWVETAFAGNQRDLANAVWRLHHAGLRAAHDRRSLAEGFRMPLASQWPLAPQVDAWLAALRAEGLRVGDLVVRGGGDVPPMLHVFLRPLTAADFRLAQGECPPGITDLATYREPADVTGIGAFRRQVNSALCDQTRGLGALAELIEDLRTTTTVPKAKP
jgi:hypothetical protein